MKKINNKIAVSEVLGTILLLLISVTIFSVVYVSFFSVEIDNQVPSVDMVGTIQDNNLILEHRGGDSISLGTEIMMFTDPSTGFSEMVKANENDYLDSDSKLDGYWNIGERFKLDLSTIASYQRYNPLDVMVIDVVSNSVIMSGTVQEPEASDLELSMQVNNQYPEIEETIHFTINARNNGPSIAEEIKISDLLPEGLDYKTHTCTKGSYSPLTGIWTIDILDKDEEAVLTLDGQVSYIDTEMPFTQLVFVIDGSDSITSEKFQLILQSISASLIDGRIPHNDKIELTVIQYGTNPIQYGSIAIPIINVEIGPIVIKNNFADPGHYIQIANQVLAITQIGGGSPLSTALYETRETIYNSENFQESNMQIIDFITDGMPNIRHVNLKKTIPGAEVYIEDLIFEQDEDIFDFHIKYNIGPIIDYLIDTLEMTDDQDQINALVVDGAYGFDLNFLKDYLVWPQPGYIAPPITETGWVREFNTMNQFKDSVSYQLNIDFFERTNIAELISQKFIDPDVSNNIAKITIIPVFHPG